MIKCYCPNNVWQNLKKRLSALYEQLLKCKSSNYKNKFMTSALLKKIELYVLRFGQWAKVAKQTVRG